MKYAYPASAALLALSIATWLLWTYPREMRRESDDLTAARSSALAEYKVCVKAAERDYSDRWSAACQTQSDKEASDCRIDAICLTGTYSKGTDTCSLRQGASNVDATKVRDRCAAAFPFNRDCTLPTEGPTLNTALEKSKADCRTGFDMNLYGLGAHRS